MNQNVDDSRRFRGIDEMTSIFVSYSHKDDELQNQLQIHLAMLKRQGVIDVWHDRRVVPGDEIDPAIGAALEEAQVILLLVSSDFLASDYCYDKEMHRAMERHASGEARVLPVILRPCDWHGAPFGKLLAVPKDGKPVVKWANIDEAFLEVTQGIRRAVEAIAPVNVRASRVSEPSVVTKETGERVFRGPRSSNLRVRQSFSEVNKDRFLNDGFEYMASFFENSLAELGSRNPGIETSFKRIDTRRFTAVVYRNGEALSRCQVFMGGLGRATDSISYSMNDVPSDSSFNECLTVEEGEQMLGLRPMGMWHGGEVKRSDILTFEGGAEFYWSILVDPLQG